MPSHRQDVIACVTSAESRESVVRAATGRFNVHFCSTTKALARTAALIDASLIIWEVGEGAEDEIESIVHATSHRSDTVSILVRLDLTKTAARQVMVLVQCAPFIQVSLRNHDDLALDIALNREQPAERRVCAEVIKQLLPRVSDRCKRIVVAAALVGHRRTSVREFARLCESSVRAIQWNLRAAGIAPAKNILGWMLALNALWRLDALAWNSKRASRTSGFSSRDAWAHYIARHVGARPKQLLRDGGFAALLSRCESEMLSSTHCQRSDAFLVQSP